MVAVGEYGYVTAQQVQNLNMNSQGSLEGTQLLSHAGESVPKVLVKESVLGVQKSQEENPLCGPSINGAAEGLKGEQSAKKDVGAAGEQAATQKD
mmetsp:Transcript_25807/g.34509  ORF Transcript_25807/g.34509 Transcript_25807/m.34509 type:complete len:95 (+) Transcript_25807:1252-1536(+)